MWRQVAAAAASAAPHPLSHDLLCTAMMLLLQGWGPEPGCTEHLGLEFEEFQRIDTTCTAKVAPASSAATSCRVLGDRLLLQRLVLQNFNTSAVSEQF